MRKKRTVRSLWRQWSVRRTYKVDVDGKAERSVRTDIWVIVQG